ncbi:MAG: hypothetical protein IPL06_17735 [Betaproteobacteria bacterium]|nr:hypothetical protein [Betaproteobacteria bacterium]
MATYRILARIVELGPREHLVTVSALAEDKDSTEVRMASLSTAAEARERKDFLVMSLATELRALGHVTVGMVE